jgi:hypothetical protein
VHGSIDVVDDHAFNWHGSVRREGEAFLYETLLVLDLLITCVRLLQLHGGNLQIRIVL